MDDLIEALQILRKYMDPKAHNPTNCGHDELFVGADQGKVTAEDLARLDELGFFPNTEYGEGFSSFRFGSC